MSRDLTPSEREIVRLCHEKYGSDTRDEISFFPSGEAVMVVWGNSDGPFVHLTNVASMLEDGVLSLEEIRDTQL